MNNTPRTVAAAHIGNVTVFETCLQLERELAELTEHVGLCHDAIGESRGSDTSELHTYFANLREVAVRLGTALTRVERLEGAVRCLRHADGWRHTQRAVNNLLDLVPVTEGEQP